MNKWNFFERREKINDKILKIYVLKLTFKSHGSVERIKQFESILNVEIIMQMLRNCIMKHPKFCSCCFNRSVL